MNMSFAYRTFEDSELDDYLIDYNNEDPYIKVDKCEKNIKYFNNRCGGWNKHVYFTCIDEDNGDIIGIVKLKIGGEDSCNYPGWNNWVCYISVDKNWYGYGIGRYLVDNMLQYAQVEDLKILMSGYSARGWMHLHTYIHCVADVLGVVIQDDANRPTFIDWNDYEGYTEEEYKSIVDQY